MESVSKFLGFEVTHLQGGGYFLSNTGYIESLAESFKLHDFKKRVDIPLQPNVPLEPQKDDVFLEDPTLYQSLLGGLLYLQMCTRVDLSFAVNRFARVAREPTMRQFNYLKKVLKYAVNTKELGLTYQRQKTRENSFTVSSEVDSSWGDAESRKSTYGYLVRVQGCLIGWKTKVSDVIALSTSEAEFMGIAEVVKEMKYIRNVVDFVGFQVKPLQVENDNQGALKMCQDYGSIRKTRHMELRFFYVTGLVTSGEVEVKYKATKELVADALTKALAKPQFLELRKGMLSKV